MKRRILRTFLIFSVVLSSCEREDSGVSGGLPERSAEYDLENKVVRSYLDLLDMMPYRDGDYSYSVVDDYYAMTTSYRKDHPYPVSVEWEFPAGGGNQRILVADNPDFTDPVIYSISGSAVSYDIYNLIPGKHYHWKVTSSSGEYVDGGEFMTTGRRRFLKVDNICNVRDLGGILTADGRKRIRFGLVFRGAVLDLRTDSEAVGITSSPLGEDIDYVRFSNANDYYYDKCWTSDVYILAIQWHNDRLREGKPVYFHCIYGADRTGTLAFLLESLLGVGENELAKDYEL
ncbi:MAG: tyrosine-protein phosphatase, partial [Bacteroidales bacterium]|nr:tyrosine-protein phosphatase [Bacteroidales bacterium]